MWQLFILLHAALASVSTTFQRWVLKDKSVVPEYFSAWFQIAGAVIFGILWLIVRGFSIPDVSGYWQNILLSGVLYAAGTIFIFKALQKGEASKFTVIFSLQSLFAIAAAYFFLGESLLLFQWIGVFIILLSVILISFTPDSLSFDKDEIFAVLAAMCFGFARVNDKFIIGQMDLYLYLFIGFLIPGIILFMAYPKALTKYKTFFKKEMLQKLSISGFIYSLAILALYYALSMTQSSQVIAASVAGVVFTELLGIFVLKERKNIRAKIFGTILVGIGLVLISMPLN
ncbi:MAG: GRP family sugar transporter [Candidatus Dojkabacteria bacterium]|nr:MAG: GRP family sugar transporter [Candidatus Dojkabacteria bacterium]